MKCILPFRIKYSPIKKLALLPFEKKPDEIYRGLELQFMSGEKYGDGYRIIAYRNDNYVDVYDDESILFDTEEVFDVTEKGLNQHVQTKLRKVHFENQTGNEYISFEFNDIKGRLISFSMKENSKKKTIPFNLLAPVGVGSVQPNFMPVFFMYQFDFMRVKHTQVRFEIDGAPVQIDRFPMPMNRQFRYFARYSEICQLFEFINTDEKELHLVETDGQNRYVEEQVEYQFNEAGCLSQIDVLMDEDKIHISFIPELDLQHNSRGRFRILPRKEMGMLEGSYEISNQKEKVNLRIVPTDGWASVPTSFLSRIILSKKSVFCTWSKGYELNATMDLNTKQVEAKWTNHNIKDTNS